MEAEGAAGGELVSVLLLLTLGAARALLNKATAVNIKLRY